MILIACEFSGVVREAFAQLGYYAVSCDRLPTETPCSKNADHHVGDVRDILGEGWNLMIAFPPCTYLSNSGVKHLYLGGRKENGPDPERWAAMRSAVEFFLELWNAPIHRIAAENPIMHGHAKRLLGVEHSQIIQPYEYGHGETKATCLRLKNLPLLKPTDIVEGRHARVHREAPGPDRWKNRSRTLQGIADAMADQWGSLPEIKAVA